MTDPNEAILDGISDSMDKNPKKWRLHATHAAYFEGDSPNEYTDPDVSIYTPEDPKEITITAPCTINNRDLDAKGIEDLRWELNHLREFKFQELILSLHDRYPPRGEPGERTPVAHAIERLMRDPSKWKSNGDWLEFYDAKWQSAVVTLEAKEVSTRGWFGRQKYAPRIILRFRDPHFLDQTTAIVMPLTPKDQKFLYEEAQHLRKAIILRKLGSSRLASGI